MHRAKVAILGGGNMGEAIAKGLRERAQRVFPLSAGDIIFAEPDARRHAQLTAGGHCRAALSAREALSALRPEGLVIVAVKPQVFPSVAAEVGDVIGNRLVISIMAGTEAARVRAELGGAARVVRIMPSIAMTVGVSMAAACAGPGSTPEDLSFAVTLFKALGDCIEIPESLMDAFTALAASGPAYVAYLAEAMTDAGVALGFRPEEALRIVQWTVHGAGELIDQERDGPASVRARITSKGGTTAAAIGVLDGAHAKELIVRAITAARDRGRELRRV